MLHGTIPLLIDCLYSLCPDERKRFISRMLDIPINHEFDIITDIGVIRYTQTERIVDTITRFNTDSCLCQDLLAEKYGKIVIQK